MEQRWGFLAPWCMPLRTRITYKWPSSEEEVWAVQKRFLQVALPTRQDAAKGSRDFLYKSELEFKNAFQRFREALALLAAVAHVDQAGWRYLLQVHCGVHLGEEGEEGLEEEIPARFRFSIQERNQRKIHKDQCLETLERDLAWFCGVNQRASPSGEYLRDLEKIAALDAKLRGDEPGVEIKVPVEMLCPRVATSKAVKAIEDYYKAEKAIREEWEEFDKSEEKKEVAHGALRCTFVLQPMGADFGGSELALEMVQTLDALVRQKCWFSQVASWLYMESKLRSSERAGKSAMGQLMSCFFDSTRRSRERGPDIYEIPEGELQPRQIGAVHLHCVSVLKAPEFAAIFSAIALTQTTTKLSIHPQVLPISNQVLTGDWWKWLAYGIFSNRARACSSVESLAITSIGSLSTSDVEAFKAVLASEHPEEYLCGCPRGELEERDATLKAGARVRWQFDDQGQPLQGSRAMVFKSPTSYVRTFSDDGSSDWVNVMIPGYGRCQVQRRDLNFDDAAPLVGSPRGVVDLKIAFTKDEYSYSEGLPQFLEAVGSSLEYLTLEGTMDEVNEDVMQKSCPNLKELSILGYFFDVRLDLRDYHEKNESLPLMKWNWNDIPELVAAMSDVDCPISKSARRLRIRLIEDWSGPWTSTPPGFRRSVIATDVAELLQMMEVNKALEYVDVVLPSKYHQYAADIRKHHLTPIDRALPLSTDAKTALLSVLSTQTTSSGGNTKKRKGEEQAQAGLPSLDQHVLAKIFAFAAPPILRQVYVSKPSETHGWDSERTQVVI